MPSGRADQAPRCRFAWRLNRGTLRARHHRSICSSSPPAPRRVDRPPFQASAQAPRGLALQGRGPHESPGFRTALAAAARPNIIEQFRCRPPDLDREGSAQPHRESPPPMPETARPTGDFSCAAKPSRKGSDLASLCASSSNRRLQCSAGSGSFPIRSVGAPPFAFPKRPSPARRPRLPDSSLHRRFSTAVSSSDLVRSPRGLCSPAPAPRPVA